MSFLDVVNKTRAVLDKFTYVDGVSLLHHGVYLVMEIADWIYKSIQAGHKEASVFGVLESFLSKTPLHNRWVLQMALPSMQPLLEGLYRSIDVQRIQVDVGEGLYKCFYCQSNSTTSMQIQTRAADEPADTLVKCNECGKSRIMH
jgi:DNA-directed RNA polymerase subunit M/transcription elongation factor TFIIS